MGEPSRPAVRLSGPTGELRIPAATYRALYLRFAHPYWFTPAELDGVWRNLGAWIDEGLLEPAEPFRGYSAIRNAGRGGVSFVFEGARSRLMLPPHEFIRQSGLASENVVLLRDGSRRFYTAGISPDLPSLPILLGWLAGYVAAREAGPVRCAGTSMGAFAAIVAGGRLGADEVFAFAPERLRYEDDEGRTWDLLSAIRGGAPHTHYHVYFNRGQERDRRVAEALAGCPRVVLHPQDGIGHDVVRHLAGNGLLARCFTRPADGAIDGPDRGTHGAPVSAEAIARFLEEALEPRPGPLTPDTTLHGLLDSFAVLDLLAFLARDYGVQSERGIPDEALTSPRSVADWAGTASSGVARRSGVASSARHRERLEIGLQHTGIRNLSEGSLMRHLGAIHWSLLGERSALPIHHWRDRAGRRVLPVVFYLELELLVGSLDELREGDALEIEASAARYDTSVSEAAFELRADSESAFPARGRVLLASRFAAREPGTGKLEGTSPTHAGFLGVPVPDERPRSLDAVRRARARLGFGAPSAGFRVLCDRAEASYRIVPERDLNGAGLVYFANYPEILDACERQALVGSAAASLFGHDQLDRRGVVSRRLAFYENPGPRDELQLQLRVWQRRRGPQELEILVDAVARRCGDDDVLLLARTLKRVPAPHRSVS